MRKITVITMISLDGVMQAPGDPEEDRSGAFKYGGWTAPYEDEVDGKIVLEQLHQNVDYFLGRKTFDIWESYWPKHADFWPRINEGTKYVISKTLKKSDWKNTVFIETLDDIKRVKNSKGPDIQVWGSSGLVQLLFKNDLVDQLCLKIYPLILGTGKKLFSNDAFSAAFKLTESVVTPTGIIIANYKRAGEIAVGIAGSTLEPQTGNRT